MENIIAVELLCAAQGVDIRQLRKPVTLGKGTRVAYQIVRSTLPRIFDENGIQRDRISDDVLIHKDIEMLQKLVQSGDLLRQVQNAVPSFSI